MATGARGSEHDLVLHGGEEERRGEEGGGVCHVEAVGRCLVTLFAFGCPVRQCTCGG